MKSCLAQAAALLLALAAGRAFAMEFGALYGLGSRTWRRQAQRERELAMAANQVSRISSLICEGSDRQIRVLQNSHATTHFFTDAKVDHFGSIESSRDLTWRQRFHVDSTHWGGSGSPVFLYIGGEGPAARPNEPSCLGAARTDHQGQSPQALPVPRRTPCSWASWPRSTKL